MKYIQGKDTFETWKSVLRFILENGKDYVDADGRICREVLNLAAEIQNPKENISKPITLLSSLGKWIYPPIDEIAEVVLKAENLGTYEYCYGPRVFKYRGDINQIDDYVIPLLRANPNSRRAVISLWDPVEDTKIGKGNVVAWLISDFKIREEKLYLTFYGRSIDFFIGWPVNIYQQFLLMEKVAKELNVGLGSLTTFVSSAHIFLEYTDQINKILKFK